MKKRDTGYVAYYAEYVDTDGKKHYAVHQCRKTDKWVWSMRDYKFQGSKYDCKGNDNMNEHNTTIDAKPDFNPDAPSAGPTKFYCVHDRSNRLIAKFKSKRDADEYRIKGRGEYTVTEEVS